jgi:hypothetical protein
VQRAEQLACVVESQRHGRDVRVHDGLANRDLPDHQTAGLLRTGFELPTEGVLDRVQVLEALPVGLPREGHLR